MPAFASRRTRESTSVGLAIDTNTGSNNNPAVITLPARDGVAHSINGILCGYSNSGTLSGGLLTVTMGGVTVFSQPINAKGELVIPYRRKSRMGEEVVITLAAGGSNVDATLNLLDYEAVGAPADDLGAMQFDNFLMGALLGAI